MKSTFQRLLRTLAALVFPLGGLATTFYLTPTGTGTGVAGDPAGVNLINWLIQNDTDQDEEVVLRFAPGEYILSTGISRYAHHADANGNYVYLNKRVALLGDNPCRSADPTVFKWAANLHSDPGKDDEWREVRMVDMSRDPNFERLVIENIVFDGNFTGQSAVVGPRFREGYKSLAVMANAKSGRIKNCMIRNFGSQGFMPGSLGAPSGVESFQLLITGTDPIPRDQNDPNDPCYRPFNWPLGPKPDTHNWVIEDNEVSDLHFAYGGYCTAIVLNIPQTEPYQPPGTIPAADPQKRAGVVRRNVVRGRYGDRLSIGFGVANFGNWSGRVTFTDNLVMNANTGFNTDTGNFRELDFVRNFFLDVSAIGNLGSPDNGNPAHAHYTVQDNFVRLRGRRAQQYCNDYTTVGQVTQSDPALDLWRPLRGPATGLSIVGNCEKIVLRNNRFTTWPGGLGTGVVGPDNFLHVPFPLAAASGDNDGWWKPNPHPTWETASFGANWWSLVVPYANNVAYTEEIFARSREAAKNVTLRDNHVSSLPFYVSPDSASTTVTDLGTSGAEEMATLPQGVSQNSTVGHTVMRQPLVGEANQFRPIGFIGRVAPFYVRHPDHTEDPQWDVFRGVVEVAIDKFQHHPQENAAVIRARVVEYRNNATTPTYVWRHSSQYVQMQLLGGQTVAGAWPANLVATQPRTLPLSSDGFITFRVTGLPSPPFTLAARVWLDGQEDFGRLDGGPTTDGTPAIPGVPALSEGNEGTLSYSTWEESRDAWAEARLDVPGTTGNVVRLFTQPDVANEKSGKRAKLIFTRSGSTASALGVTFYPPINGNNGPLIRRGTYGTTGTADYYLDWSSATYQAAVPADQRPVTSGTGLVSVLPTDNTTPGKVVFPAGSARVVVDVVARTDDVFERETAYFTVADGDGYVAADPKDAAVILYDGPEWTIRELTISTSGYYAATSEAYAVNDVDGTQQPKISGYATWQYNSSGSWQNASGGGYWSLPGLSMTYYVPLIFRGISTSPLKLVGTAGSVAQVYSVPGSSLNLPHLAWGANLEFHTGPSFAYGINAAATVIAGSSLNELYAQRPVVWEGPNYTASMLARDLGTGPGTSAGAANAVNANRQVVGKFQVSFNGGDAGSFGFRTKVPETATAPPNPLNPVQTIEFVAADGTQGDILHSIGKSGKFSLPAEGAAISANGSTVGWSWNSQSKSRATYWASSSPASSVVAMDLGVYGYDNQSKAKGINNAGWIVGWSGTISGSNSVTNRAVLKRGASDANTAWIDLNDKHFVHGLSGWVLKSAEAINNSRPTGSGHIVGTGLLNGSPRAFVLVPNSIP